MDTGKIIVGTAAGLAVGGILGILFAPEKGSVTRQQISDKKNNSLKDLKSKFGDFADILIEKFQSVKKETQDLTEKEIEKNFEKLQMNLEDEAKNF